MACLTHIGLLHRLAGPPVDARTLPDARRHHLGALCDVPVVHRRAPGRPEVRADALAGERTERHRRVGRAAAGGAAPGDGGLPPATHPRAAGGTAGRRMGSEVVDTRMY